MTRFDELAAEATRLRQEGKDIEDVLRVLRDNGATIMDSVKVIRQVESVHLGTAKEIVDASVTWADHYSSNDELRRVAIEAMEENPD
jgi:ribosomal protein L7/L12